MRACMLYSRPPQLGTNPPSRRPSLLQPLPTFLQPLPSSLPRHADATLPNGTEQVDNLRIIQKLVRSPYVDAVSLSFSAPLYSSVNHFKSAGLLFLLTRMWISRRTEDILSKVRKGIFEKREKNNNNNNRRHVLETRLQSLFHARQKDKYRVPPIQFRVIQMTLLPE